jgi:hypothetical protein
LGWDIYLLERHRGGGHEEALKDAMVGTLSPREAVRRDLLDRSLRNLGDATRDRDPSCHLE